MLLVALLAVAGVLVIGDRVAAAYAQNSASDFLVVHAPFEEKPTVRVHGVPFLTQALRGRYDDVEVSGGGLQLGDIRGASLDAHLRGVHLGLRDIVKRDVRQLAIDRVDGNVTLPYPELARLSGVSGLTLTGDSGGVRVTLGVSVPLIGRVQLSGTADIVLSGSNIRLKLTKLAAVGVSVPSLVLSQLSQAVQVPIAIPALPYGLMISSVAAADTGVVVHGAASDVVLTATGS